SGTAAKVRVLIESTDGHRSWTSLGVSSNVMEASWQAIIDSVLYKLVFPGKQTGALGAQREREEEKKKETIKQ
ncbi:MAG: hypothetical protein E2P08_04550, partial [Acidobacteria bacterium]